MSRSWTEQLDEKAMQRVQGPAWESLRKQFETVSAALLAVSPVAHGKLTTIYIKFGSDETGQRPFAVLWAKSSAQLVLGLALPDAYDDDLLTGPIPGYKYSGLTRYIIFKPETTVPAAISKWAQDSYTNLCDSQSA